MLELTLDGDAECVASFVRGTDCADPLEAWLALAAPAESCDIVVSVAGTDYDALGIDGYEATVTAHASHPIASIRWAVPLGDPYAPAFVDDYAQRKTLTFHGANQVQGAAVEITDTCTPARTAQAQIFVQNGYICP